MSLDEVARAFVPRIEQVPESKIELPHEQVMCECPAPCWAAKSTIDGLKATGMPYKFHCTKCAPAELRNTIQAAVNKAKADPKRDRTQPVTGLFSPGIGIIMEGSTPEDVNLLLAMARGEAHPRELEPVTITMTLDLGEWVDILTTLDQTVEWLEKAHKPDDPVHPRGEKHMANLAAKVKRHVLYEANRQVINKGKPDGK